MIRIELTAKQRKELEPLLDQVRSANAKGETCILGAQVWLDGIVVVALHGEKAKTLAKGLGGGKTAASSSLERFRDHQLANGVKQA